MSRARRKRHASDAAQPPVPTRRRGMWLRAGVLVAFLVCMVMAVVYWLQSRDVTAASPATAQESTHAAPVAASQEPLPEAGRQKLVGRWQRADANYVLEIRAVAADGQMDAIYWNPQPIHVSKAKATSESGKMTVIVELRDRLYPGSYYTLAYDPGKDQLAGVYHHLGVHQDYDVVFTRIGQN